MDERFYLNLARGQDGFGECERLLKEGVDINEMLDYPDGNSYLAQAILYVPGERLVPIIRFCIEHGFDVGKMGGRFGAECLENVCYSSYDRYIVDAGRELIRAGAVDMEVEESKNVLETAIEKKCYEETFFPDCAVINYFEAYIRMLEALHEGDTEADFGTFHDAEGKTIMHVYAAKKNEGSTFVDKERHKNTFRDTLYFEYREGFLAVDKYLGIWTSGRLPTGKIEDVSKHFKMVLGRTINSITFEEHGKPCQYELRINMDSGRSISFETNYSETNEESEHCAFCDIVF